MLSDIQGAVFSSLHNMYSKRYLQFKDEHHFVLILKGVVEVDKLAVVEVVHDVNLLADQSLLHGVPDGDELGGVHMLSLQLSAAVDLQRRDYKILKKTNSKLLLLWTVPGFLWQDQVFSHLSSHDISML